MGKSCETVVFFLLFQRDFYANPSKANYNTNFTDRDKMSNKALENLI